MATFSVDTEPLEQTLREALNVRPLLHQIGAYLQSVITDRFQTQRTGSEDWAARSVPNVPGVLKYLSGGQASPSIPERYFRPRPALVDTGRLRQSITYAVDEDGVRVGTNVAYARKHVEGGEETIEVTADQKRALSKWIKGNPGEKARSLRYLLNRDEITVKIPQRNFLEIDEQLQDEIVQLIDDYIERQLEAESHESETK